MRGITSEPAGFTFVADFIDQTTEDLLLSFICTLEFESVTMRGNTAKRTVHHFGRRYDYGSKILKDAEPIPKELARLVHDAEEFAGLAEGLIVELLINHYPNGASVGWHNDASVYKTIIGISLGSSCRIQFKTKSVDEPRVFEQTLPPRSAYVMRDEVRDDWQHRIPPTSGERYSLTLRSLSES